MTVVFLQADDEVLQKKNYDYPQLSVKRVQK